MRKKLVKVNYELCGEKNYLSSGGPYTDTVDYDDVYGQGLPVFRQGNRLYTLDFIPTADAVQREFDMLEENVWRDAEGFTCFYKLRPLIRCIHCGENMRVAHAFLMADFTHNGYMFCTDCKRPQVIEVREGDII